MPALFIFLLKVNAALLLFCAGYYLVLRHLTFYTLNRVYLMGAIIFATVYPQINLDAFFQRHQQLAQPVEIVVTNLQLPEQLAQPAYWTWAEGIFFAGVIILAAKLGMQLFSLYKVYRASRKEQVHGHEVRVVNGDGGPFSFWKSIYVNPTGYNDEDLRAILKHEQIHTDEWHTIDILLAELSVIFYWFNPGVWLMRKAVRENIEFITDRKILQQGADTKQYQYSLLNVSFSNTRPGIANHFNISTLKKRILMMNAKRSSKITLTRYAFLVPVLLVLLLSFSVTRAAIVKTSKLTYKAIATSVDHIVQDNPVTNKIEQLFNDSLKMQVAEKKNDTIKIIRTGRKDTMKIVGNVITMEPVIQVRDTTKPVRILNFITSDTNTHKILHVRINGKDFQSIGEGKFVVKTDSMLSKRDTVQFRGGMPAPSAFGGSGSYPMRVALNYSIKGFNATQRDSAKKVNDLLQHIDGFNVNDEGDVIKMVNSKPVNVGKAPVKRLEVVRVYGNYAPRAANIDSVQNKLILIDGKQATDKDLKKMPASDIEKLRFQPGSQELSKQYGDKAKNGVLFITTKKQ